MGGHPRLRLLAAGLAVALCAPAAGAEPEDPALLPSAFRFADHPDWSGLALPEDPVGTALRAALAGSNRYALNTWWPTYMSGVAPYWAAADRLRQRATLDSEEVRRYTSVAYGLAASLATGAYDPARTGVDALTATTRVVDVVDFVARTHRANVSTEVGWGHSWQSAMWAGQAATAGWLLGPALPASTQLLLARMLAYEADWVTSRAPRYLRDRSGKVLTPGDSAAEELAWDAVGLFAAVELLPHHERRAAWAEAAYARFAGAYARPVDVTSPVRVNGRPLSAWVGGSNVEPNGFVVNHSKVNPDYTTDIKVWAAPVPALAGHGVPEAVLTNIDVTYRALTTVRFPAPPYAAPGGTVYTPKGIYYPAGVSWGKDREVVYGSLDVQTAVLTRDPRIRAAAIGWARVHLDKTLRMQARFPTGQIYGPVTEDRYTAREEHAAMLLGVAYLTWWLGANRWIAVDATGVETKAPM